MQLFIGPGLSFNLMKFPELKYTYPKEITWYQLVQKKKDDNIAIEASLKERAGPTGLGLVENMTSEDLVPVAHCCGGGDSTQYFRIEECHFWRLISWCATASTITSTLYGVACMTIWLL